MSLVRKVRIIKKLLYKKYKNFPMYRHVKSDDFFLILIICFIPFVFYLLLNKPLKTFYVHNMQMCSRALCNSNCISEVTYFPWF